MLQQRKVEPYGGSIPPQEVRFHPHSFGDTDGRLFWWKGDLYRGIRARSAPFFAGLLRDGVIENLVDAGLLIETLPAAVSLDGYEMVVHHKRVPFVSYPNEWCVEMFKAGALQILELEIELIKRALTLKDGHPWNLLFDGCKPVYVDLTSIEPLRGEPVWPAYDEYSRFCYYPLILMCHGQERIARSLVSDYEGVQRSDLSIVSRELAFTPLLLTKGLRRALKPFRSRLRRKSSTQAERLSFLEKLRGDLEKMKSPKIDFLSQEPAATGSKQDALEANQRALRRVLNEVKPRTVLDAGSGEDSFSTQAARFGCDVVSFDADPACVTRLYREACKEGLSILPLVMNFVKPSPSVGYSSHYSMAAAERFKCDLVLAFSLVKELVFERHFNFELICEGLSSFSKRWLVVEFILREDREIGAKCDERFSWYTLDNFISNLKTRFGSVTVIPSEAKHRALLLCEK